MFTQHFNSGVEYLAPSSSSSTLEERLEVHKHRQQMNNISQRQVTSSNVRNSSQSGDGDAGNGENGESFNNHENKTHNGDHGKSPDNDGNSSGSRGAGGDDGPDKGSGKDGCRRATGDSGTGWNNDNHDNDCSRGSVFYDIRDNDPRVHYTGPWVSKTAHNWSSTSTVVDGSTVSLKFNGSAIAVFGTVPASMSEPPTVAYFVDSLPPSIITLPHATADMPNHQLYTSPSLSWNEEHLLFINVTKTMPEIPYALAGFSLSHQALGSNSSQFSQGTPTMATPTATLSTTVSTAPASTNSTTMLHHKTISIVAGILGSLAFLLIVGAVVFLILRWRTYARRELSGRLYSESMRSTSETVYSAFTTTESILRNDPSIWNLTPSHVSFNEASSQVSRASEFPRPNDLSWPNDFARPREDTLSSMEFASSRSLSTSLSVN